jgi:hypothetical protein
MEKTIRRIDRAITEAEAKEMLEKGEHGILSTISLDGQPYGVPLNQGERRNLQAKTPAGRMQGSERPPGYLLLH